MEREKIIDDIVTAKGNGVRIFLQGVIHNYSRVRSDDNGLFYIPEKEKNSFTGKRILGECEIVDLIKPDLILLETYTPRQIYVKGRSTGFKQDLFSRETDFLSPNLREILPAVHKHDIKVYGIEFMQDPMRIWGEHKLFNYRGFFQEVKTVYDGMAELGGISSNEEEIYNNYLLSSDKGKDKGKLKFDMRNPNEYYHACESLEKMFLLLDRFNVMKPRMSVMRRKLALAQEAMRAYIKGRDLFSVRTIKQEYMNGRTIILKEGKVHFTEKYGITKKTLADADIAFYHFDNLMHHEEGDRLVREEAGK